MFLTDHTFILSPKVLCEDITKDQIEAIMTELLQLYDMEAKCTWEGTECETDHVKQTTL